MSKFFLHCLGWSLLEEAADDDNLGDGYMWKINCSLLARREISFMRFFIHYFCLFNRRISEEFFTCSRRKKKINYLTPFWRIFNPFKYFTSLWWWINRKKSKKCSGRKKKCVNLDLMKLPKLIFEFLKFLFVFFASHLLRLSSKVSQKTTKTLVSKCADYLRWKK